VRLAIYPGELERLDRIASRAGVQRPPEHGRSPGLPSVDDALRARVARRAMAIGMSLLESDAALFEAEI
jgi:hypothetical protein